MRTQTPRRTGENRAFIVEVGCVFEYLKYATIGLSSTPRYSTRLKPRIAVEHTVKHKLSTVVIRLHGYLAALRVRKARPAARTASSISSTLNEQDMAYYGIRLVKLITWKRQAPCVPCSSCPTANTIICAPTEDYPSWSLLIP